MPARLSLAPRVAVPAFDAHPSSYVVRDFVEALIRAGVEPIRLPRRVGPLLAHHRRTTLRLSKRPVIVPMMGPRADVLAVASLLGPPIPFCWDVWEPKWELWADLLTRFHAPLVITTASQSADHLRTVLEDCAVHHLSEAINVRSYRSGPALSVRSIDVLELGRRYDAWHDRVTAAGGDRRLNHLYELEPGKFVFADESALVAGLSESKLSVCFPSNKTHPSRSGAVSTLTSRYLEGMASRCLLLGEAPFELSALLGFDPVVRAVLDDPVAQLDAVLDSIELYQPQVDAAYHCVRSVGDWDSRARQLLELVCEL